MKTHSYLTIAVFSIAAILFFLSLTTGAAVLAIIGVCIEILFSALNDKRKAPTK